MRVGGWVERWDYASKSKCKTVLKVLKCFAKRIKNSNFAPQN